MRGSRRVFGTFLSWLQERKREVFFVDLPDAAARAEILRIHLRKRKQDPARVDVAALAQASEGFSGAELEQAVVGGLYGAFASNATLDTARLAREIAGTRPLSGTMRERIAELRRWASDRTVPAG